ncbi:hypothetical protein KP22_04080 [Pectobacterium betavasculorum]|uniref:Uncharacterized protein n=1 Tax=Pectobacterium betavasculorum TaxID=55207 RepID=A0A093SAV5_9GAMM|nr:hypothetical protein [Pectobacterium betavasculorum]KFX07276.1 hypothetical protein KP22_04080 [Pectobacterium betavasculorum]
MVFRLKSTRTTIVSGYPIPSMEQVEGGYLMHFQLQLPVPADDQLTSTNQLAQVTLDHPIYAKRGDDFVLCPTSQQSANVTFVEEDLPEEIGVGKNKYFTLDTALFVHSSMIPTHFKNDDGRYIELTSRKNVLTDPDAPVINYSASIIYEAEISVDDTDVSDAEPV